MAVIIGYLILLLVIVVHPSMKKAKSFGITNCKILYFLNSITEALISLIVTWYRYICTSLINLTINAAHGQLSILTVSPYGFIYTNVGS